MPHIIEIAILLLLVFLIGCVIGYFVRMRLFPQTIAKQDVEVAEAPPTATSSEPSPPAPAKKATVAQQKTKPATGKAKPVKAQSAAKASPRTAKPAAKTPAKPKVAAKPKPKPVVESSNETGGRPETLSAPRAAGKDDLKRLSGVGPKLEATLNSLGIYHFDQIASWDRDAIAWVDDNLSFKGRIDREGWIAQAAKLAAEK